MIAGYGSSGWGGNLTASGGGGSSTPAISNFVPPQGMQIDPGQALSFDVTSEAAIVAISVSIFYDETGAAETVFTAGEFAPNYVNGSTWTPSANGYSFSIRRRAGWPLSPRVSVEIADAYGNTAQE